MKILVVDDDKEIVELLSIYLKNEGYEPIAAYSGKEALTKLSTNPEIALMILDIMMPKMDGFVLYEQLKKVDPGIKVCFLTASEMYHEEMRGMEHRALNKDLFVQKPISTDDLVKEINNKISSN